jgi:hypothetical protein
MALPSGQCEWPMEYDEFIVRVLANIRAAQRAHADCGSRAGGAQGILTATTGWAAAVAGLIVVTA